jgi:hypothetical protein
VPKSKFGFWLVLVLVVGLCGNLLASDQDVSHRDKLKWTKNSPMFPKEATRSLLRDPWLSPDTQRFPRAVNGTGAISGYVTQASGGAPIEGVSVWADLLACPSYSGYAFSGIDGFYIIEDLPPGYYEVQTYSFSDFVDVYWDNMLPWEDADSVPVASDDTTEDIDFSLRVGGKIAGSVTLPGASDEGTTVFAYEPTSRYTYSAYAYSGSASPKAAPYEIVGLPTGNYKVQTLNFLGFIDAYYDNQSSWEDADLVSVTEGITTSSINFTLDSGGVIQGNVSVPGKGLPWCVIGYHASNLHPEWFTFWFDHGGGSYELRGLRSGYWKVLAYGDATYTSEWWNNKYSWDDATTILVTAPGTVTAIDFTLEVGGSIRGECMSRGGPLAGYEVIAYKTSSLYQQRGSLPLAFWSKSDSSSADGSYIVGGLPTGAYYVVATNGCQEMWYNNKPDLEDADSVSVVMPGDTPNIDFYLPTAVETEDELAQRPAEFELHQNYPNPFNPGTRIEYTLKKRGHVTLHIYNVLGEKVKTLLDQDQSAGLYQINWDGKNDKGKAASSGLYLYKLELNGFSQAKRMLLLK